MVSTKEHPGAFDGMERALPGEPVFTLRAHDVLAAPDPVGPHNDAVSLAALHQTLDSGVPVICGWGAHGGHRGRDQVARAMAAQLDVRLMALELNADGSPRHPLYIAHTVRPTIWT